MATIDNFLIKIHFNPNAKKTCPSSHPTGITKKSWSITTRMFIATTSRTCIRSSFLPKTVLYRRRSNNVSVLTSSINNNSNFITNNSRKMSSEKKKMMKKKPIALFLNCSRLDYDSKLNFDKLASITDFRRMDVDAITSISEIVRLVNEVHAGTEILILKEMTLPSDAVEQFSSNSNINGGVKLICEAGTGYNNIPLDTCKNKHIQVCNIPTYSTDAVAQTAITYIMNFAMNMFQQQSMLDRSNDRSNFTGPFTLPLMELNSKTLGLVGGSGRIGTKVAEIGLVLGMNIIISRRKPSAAAGPAAATDTDTDTDTTPPPSLPDSHKLLKHPNVCVTYDVDELLEKSDFVSIHTPLNNETINSFGKNQIAKMKSTAYLINTSRGKVINENELINCLENKLIAGAGLDVTQTEPPTSDSKLWSLNNVVLSPHIGWRRLETRQRLVDMTTDNIVSYINTNGNDCINVVN
jgi:glycerate dehydrogenase